MTQIIYDVITKNTHLTCSDNDPILVYRTAMVYFIQFFPSVTNYDGPVCFVHTEEVLVLCATKSSEKSFSML